MAASGRGDLPRLDRARALLQKVPAVRNLHRDVHGYSVDVRAVLSRILTLHRRLWAVFLRTTGESGILLVILHVLLTVMTAPVLLMYKGSSMYLCG